MGLGLGVCVGSLWHPPVSEAGVEDGRVRSSPGAVEGATVGLSLAGDVHVFLAWWGQGVTSQGLQRAGSGAPSPYSTGEAAAMAGLPPAPNSPAQCTATDPGAGHKHLQMQEHLLVPSLSPTPCTTIPAPSPPSPPPLLPQPWLPCPAVTAPSCPALRTGATDHHVGGVQQNCAGPAAVVARGWQVQAKDGESLSLSHKLDHRL